MFGIGAPRTGISLSRPCRLHCHSVLQTRTCLPSASQRSSVRSSSSSSISSSSSSSSAASHKGIFDREAELQQLDSLQHTLPDSITLVLGPRNCGKTAVLKEMFASQADAVYIDCREIYTTTPAGLIEALLSKLAARLPQNQLEELAPSLLAGVLSSVQLVEQNEHLGKVSFVAKELVKAFQGSKGQQQLENLNGVYRALRELLAALKEKSAGDGPLWPVVVIDEANMLTKWADKYPDELGSILSNLVGLSKQDDLCHVILATSEYAFQAWLTDKIGPDFWQPEVIGDFPEAVARGFLEHELKRRASSSMLDDHAWHKVFQVCGGNAGALRRLARVVGSLRGDWDAALEVLWGGHLERIEGLAMGGGDWTPAQYAHIMLQLLDAPYHAIPARQARMLLGQHTAATTSKSQATEGRAVLERMVKANALSVRPKSDWAVDIPAEAFAATRTVVTAPSSRELYCVGQLRGQLEATLQRWQEAAATTAHGEVPRPPSPGSSPEVKEVQRQIEQVEQQIELVEQEIKDAKQQGDKEGVALLRVEKQQLRTRLGQLGEEKVLLLRICGGNGS